jgi:hypothetical protein
VIFRSRMETAHTAWKSLSACLSATIRAITYTAPIWMNSRLFARLYAASTH